MPKNKHVSASRFRPCVGVWVCAWAYGDGCVFVCVCVGRDVDSRSSENYLGLGRAGGSGSAIKHRLALRPASTDRKTSRAPLQLLRSFLSPHFSLGFLFSRFSSCVSALIRLTKAGGFYCPGRSWAQRRLGCYWVMLLTRAAAFKVLDATNEGNPDLVIERVNP